MYRDVSRLVHCLLTTQELPTYVVRSTRKHEPVFELVGRASVAKHQGRLGWGGMLLSVLSQCCSFGC